jgi:hypothetical protein
MSKKIISLILIALTSLSCWGDVNLLERFDATSALGQIRSGAQIAPGTGLEKGALKVVGNNKKNQCFYIYTMDVKPGQKYVIGFNYLTSNSLIHNTFITQVVFEPLKGHPAPRTIYFREPRSARWKHRLHEFTIPANARKARVMLRLVKAPATAWVLVDHFRIGTVRDGLARGIELTEFETSFDDWRFDRHLIFDHFMIGAGGSIVNEWRKAKVGEAFFKAVGSKEPMQYALFIENLKIQPGRNYVFEAWLKATASFAFNGNGILIFFYKDAAGRAIGQSRYHIRPTAGKWIEFTHCFTTPPVAATLDIGLNMRNMKSSEFIQLDHLRFKPGQSAAHLRYEIDPDKKSMAVTSAVTSDIVAADITNLSLAIKGSTLKNLNLQLGKPCQLDLAPFKDGAYTMKLTVNLKNGKVLESEVKRFSICNNPSWHNNIGILPDDADAPKPWKNLKLQDNQVATWNNVFQFDSALRLKQIDFPSEKTALLAAPIELKVNSKSIFSGKADWQASSTKVSAVTVVGGEGWTGTLTTSIDYMGFLRYTLKVKAMSEFTLNSGELKMKLRKIDFVYRSDASWTNVGAVDMVHNKRWSSKHFYSEVQFGELDRGLVWYASELQPAVADFKSDWISVSNNGEVAINFINAPLKLVKGASYSLSFALAPYPFRPSEDNWKRLRFRAGKNENLNLIWQTSKLFKYCGSTAEAAKPAEIQKLLANKKGALLFYQCPFYILDNIPEWSYFAKKWKGFPSRAYDMRSNGGMLVKADIRERSWQDIYLKIFVEHLRDFKWNGVYYDCFGADVFTENGRVFHPVFECRKFQERIYNAQRITNPNSLTITHTGAAEFCTSVGFSNIILMGEQYRAQCVKHTYLLEFLTLDEFRYENATSVGPDRMFLPQYRDTAKIESPAVTTHILGLVLTHNLMLYPNFINKKVELNVRDRQYEFGMTDSTFHPYWRPLPDPVGTSNPKVVVSYYRNPKGFLLALLNPTAKAQEFVLKTVPGSITYYDPVNDRTITNTPGRKYRLEPYMASVVTIYSKP